MKRTRMGKAVVSSRGQPYFVNIDEVDSFLQLFPANEKLETDILKEIMIRAIRPHAGLRNITYTDSLNVINKDTGEAVTERESAEIVRRLEEWDYNEKDYPRSMQLRVKQREELCVTIPKKKFAMANIQSKALKDGEPIILCCARNVRTTLNVNVEITKPESLLYCPNLSQVTEETDVVTCGRYISDFHVDAAGSLRMHLLLRGRKLIIIATSRQEKYAAYYNSFKSTSLDYNEKMRKVLKDPQMWDIVIQDQRLLVIELF